jgi:uncharacterized coiled-coil DUF342 family protein
MARKAMATHEAVEAAVRELRDEGLEPTQVRVQAKIGGGSFSTIGKLIAAVLEKQRSNMHHATSKTAPPDELFDMGKKLTLSVWEKSQAATAARIEQMEAECLSRVEEVTKAKAETDLIVLTLENQLDEVRAALATTKEQTQDARERASQAEGLAKERSTEIERLTRQVDGLLKQIDGLMKDLAQSRESERSAREQAAELRGQFKAIAEKKNV